MSPQYNDETGAPAGLHSLSAGASQTSPVSHDMLLDSIQDLLRRHQQSSIEEVGEVIHSSINDLKNEVQEYGSKSLAAALETQQDVASLTAEVTSLRQAQLALRQKLNHDNSNYELQVQALKDVFKEEMQKVKDVLKTAQEQVKSLRSEIQLLRQQIDCRPRFPQFSKLPPEIRHMIWNFALPRNILSVRQTVVREADGGSWPGWVYERSQPPPALAQVCRESRAVACCTGRLLPIDNTKPSSGERGSQFIGNYYDEVIEGETVWAWFDPTRDKLMLKVFALSLEEDVMNPRDAIQNLAACAKHVVLDYHDIDDVPDYLEQLFDPTYFACLERIDLVTDQLDLKERIDPTMQARIFGLDKTDVIIDLDTSRRFIQKLRLHYDSNLIDHLEEKFLDSGQKHWDSPKGEQGIKSWNKLVKKALQSYLVIQYYWSPLGGVEGALWQGERKVGASSKWIRDLEPRMPSLHRVTVLSLI